MYRIRVIPDYRWYKARISGREFVKDWTEYADGYVNDEIRNSPLLEVEKVELPKPKAKSKVKPKAKSKAVKRG